MTRGRRALIGLAVFTVGVVIRTLPLYRSPLPRVIDGVGYAVSARRTVATGTLPFPGMATDQIGFTAWLAAVHAVTGVPARFVAQPAVALAGASEGLLAAGIVVTVLDERGWQASTATGAGLLAGLLVAIEGPVFRRILAVDEQTLGLVLVPAVTVAVWRAITAGSRPYAWLGIAGPILLVIAPLHNLEGILVGSVLVLLTVAAAVRSPAGARTVPAVGLVVGFWVYLVAYHLGAAALTPLVIVQHDRFTSRLGLVGAWVVAAALAVAWWETTTDRSRRLAWFLAIAGPLGVVVANVLRPVFPGTTTTPRPLLLALVPVGVLGIVAVGGARRSPVDRDGTALLALFAGGLAFVGFALTAELTPAYLATAYRAQTFYHFPLLVFAALGGVALARSIDRRTVRRAGWVVPIGLVVLAAMTVPVTDTVLETVSFKATVTPAEFAATGFAVSHLPGPWAGDRPTIAVAGILDGAARGQAAPVETWARDGKPPPGCPTLARASWTTIGVPSGLPRPPTRVASGAYDRWRHASNVVYATAGPDPITIVVPRGDASEC